jgi:DNA-binding transcriptional ArsR family regulator
MEEDRIVLDRKSFEALAVDTRVRILKSLKQRRKTLSEIAKEQGMSVSGVKEHLETLEGVGLIEKIDDGHKWKYYELTKKGSGIVAPRELRVWILLSISMIALIASMTAMFSPPAALSDAGGAYAQAAQAPMLESAPRAAGGNSAAADDDAKSAGEPALAATGTGAREEGAVQEPVPEGPDTTIPGAVGIVSALTLLACTAVLVKNRLRTASL